MTECNCIDYPVSWTFYRTHCREVHGFDPGDNEPPGEPTQPHYESEPKWSHRQWGYVKQLEARTLHCEKKVEEFTAKRKDDRYLYK